MRALNTRRNAIDRVAGRGRGMHVFSTADVAPERRAAFWNTVYGEQFAPVKVTPLTGDDFQAELRLGAAGPVEFASIRSKPCRAERTRAQAAAAPDRKFGFLIVLEGAGLVTHRGREAQIAPGDVIVNDNTEPMLCTFNSAVSSLTLRASDGLVRSRLPFADDLCGIRLPAGAGLTRAVSAMAKCLAEQAELGLPADYGSAIAGHLLDVLATSYAMAWRRPAAESSGPGLRKALARQFIESNLAAPDLTPHRVASALRISPRYLRMLMAEDGETASSLILRRRLEECAKRLTSPMWRDHTITDIALSWGFNSTAHFARVFRERFDMSPRDYRQFHFLARPVAARVS